jgi:hypothetical protein
VDPRESPGSFGAPSKKLADIVDGKTFRKLILLDVEALKELRDLSQELIDFMEEDAHGEEEEEDDPQAGVVSLPDEPQGRREERR